jgi:Fem-1 homolog b
VECFDFDRNTPLHTLAATFPTFRPVSSEMVFKAEEIIRLFINAGIHLDVVNCEGATASKICPLRKLLFCEICNKFNDIIFSEQLEVVIKRHEITQTTLKCLASRVIAQHKINYVGIVPSQLEKFIQLHSTDKL